MTSVRRLQHGRGVAQPGSAPQWGCGGRRFKSSRPDQLPTKNRLPHPAGGGDFFLLMEAGELESKQRFLRGQRSWPTGVRSTPNPLAPTNYQQKIGSLTRQGEAIFFVDGGGGIGIEAEVPPRSAELADRRAQHAQSSRPDHSKYARVTSTTSANSEIP